MNTHKMRYCCVRRLPYIALMVKFLPKFMPNRGVFSSRLKLSEQRSGIEWKSISSL
jgi:hypothetical protein